MIVNSIFLAINNFIKSLYSSGIHFYQVIIGLFIFNVLVYILTSFIKTIDK